MRKRSVGINVRVSVTEKRKMMLMAKRCGLSLSEYLRQRALGYEPGGHPPKEVFNVLDKLDEIAENSLTKITPYMPPITEADVTLGVLQAAMVSVIPSCIYTMSAAAQILNVKKVLMRTP